MFNGSKKYGPKEFSTGARGSRGTSNAYTSHDLTAYYEELRVRGASSGPRSGSGPDGVADIDDSSLAREREV